MNTPFAAYCNLPPFGMKQRRFVQWSLRKPFMRGGSVDNTKTKLRKLDVSNKYKPSTTTSNEIFTQKCGILFKTFGYIFCKRRRTQTSNSFGNNVDMSK